MNNGSWEEEKAYLEGKAKEISDNLKWNFKENMLRRDFILLTAKNEIEKVNREQSNFFELRMDNLQVHMEDKGGDVEESLIGEVTVARKPPKFNEMDSVRIRTTEGFSEPYKVLEVIHNEKGMHVYLLADRDRNLYFEGVLVIYNDAEVTRYNEVSNLKKRVREVERTSRARLKALNTARDTFKELKGLNKKELFDFVSKPYSEIDEALDELDSVRYSVGRFD